VDQTTQSRARDQVVVMDEVEHRGGSPIIHTSKSSIVRYRDRQRERERERERDGGDGWRGRGCASGE